MELMVQPCMVRIWLSRLLSPALNFVRFGDLSHIIDFVVIYLELIQSTTIFGFRHNVSYLKNSYFWNFDVTLLYLVFSEIWTLRSRDTLVMFL